MDTLFIKKRKIIFLTGENPKHLNILVFGITYEYTYEYLEIDDKSKRSSESNWYYFFKYFPGRLHFWEIQ